MAFLDLIEAKAQSDKKTIVLPEANDSRILQATEIILKKNIANIILIGDRKNILENNNYDLSQADFINPSNYENLDDLANKLYELRKNKGMTLEQAHDLLLNNDLYFAVMLIKENLADGMVAGAINSTANVLRPALQILKTDKFSKLVSGIFVVISKNENLGHNGAFIFGDCAINQNPNPEELAEIAKSSAKSFRNLFNAEPRVAMLSHSTKGSAKHVDVDKVTQATELIKNSNPDFLIDGELQLDAAIIDSVAKIKVKENSPVAGKANVLIFPDLDAANIGYKIAQRFGNAEAYGPITQGLAKPVNDLSRGCSAEDIVGVVAITAVQAQNKN